uniref:Putative secreted protein n=1 Tax=Anopheles darlingi TaxID=43151 RepID=A0A2M4D5V7_ANODA
MLMIGFLIVFFLFSTVQFGWPLTTTLRVVSGQHSDSDFKRVMMGRISHTTLESASNTLNLALTVALDVAS